MNDIIYTIVPIILTILYAVFRLLKACKPLNAVMWPRQVHMLYHNIWLLSWVELNKVNSKILQSCCWHEIDLMYDEDTVCVCAGIHTLQELYDKFNVKK